MAKRKKTAVPILPEPVEVGPVAQLETVPAVPVILLESLYPGQYFEVNGDVYKVKMAKGDMVEVTFTEWAPSGTVRLDRYTISMPSETVVIPKK